MRACEKCNVGDYDYVSLGIASDETKRHNQLSETKRSILCELGISEHDATAFCKARNLYSPHYECNGKKKMRDGCSLCPHASEQERREWFNDYPEAISIVIELQNLVKRLRPERAPLRGYKWFIEDKIVRELAGDVE